MFVNLFSNQSINIFWTCNFFEQKKVAEWTGGTREDRDVQPVANCRGRVSNAVKSRRVESEDMLHNVLGQPIDQSTETKKKC